MEKVNVGTKGHVDCGPLYADRDVMELDRMGNFYCRHVSAMTREGLHDKSDIAAELAVRDAEISSLRAQVEELSKYPEEAVTEESVLKAVYESGLHQYAPGVLRPIWKDGIDIDVPSASLMNFARKLAAIFKEKQGAGK